jgi:hypothetical protein
MIMMMMMMMMGVVQGVLVPVCFPVTGMRWMQMKASVEKCSYSTTPWSKQPILKRDSAT